MVHCSLKLNWDYIEIRNWRIAMVCESCDASHLSISSNDDMLTSQIFRSDGSVFPGPRSDFNGWNEVATTGPTKSANGVLFGDHTVQIRDWRIKQIDDTHISVSHESGN